ncbi:MAG: glucan biosynthesis protein [Verrucomicrobiota bacterium]
MRLHLTLALITVIALVVTLHYEHKHRFTFAEVDAMAQKRAEAKYVPLPSTLPPQLTKLTPQQDGGIFLKETARLWRRKGLPFQVDFYHPLNSNPQPHISPAMNVVDRKGSHPLAYSPAFFNFVNMATKPPSALVFEPPLPQNLGYAGFYVRYPNMGIGSNPASLDGFFSALGASYFRAIAKDQVYGLSSRGIAINTSMDRPEEFPNFVEWWLVEPTSNATELTLMALLDGPSVSGAYEFRLRPGVVTSVDIHASLYFRNAIDRLGIAPFSSMYLYGENAADHFGDNFHPEVHDSDGLLMQSSSDEWQWQPLSESDDPRAGSKGYQLQYYTFQQENPKGFGLIQRDRDFQHYQDLNMLYNVRPSAWVMPSGDWGKGEITLVERPSNDFNTDNVVMFWHPADPIKAGDHRDFSYTIDFYMSDSERPPVAFCKQTLITVPAPLPPVPWTPPVIPVPPPKPEAGGAPSKPGAKPGARPATNVASATPPAPRPFVGPPSPHTGPPIPIGTTPVQFLIDFAGGGIEDTPANQPPDLHLVYDPPGTYLREKSVEKNGYDNSWRVTFTIIPYKHYVHTHLKCWLTHNNKPITEIWNYTWRQ